MASKKGVESSWVALLGILMLLLGGVVLLSFISNAGKIAVSAADKNQCLASVRAQAAAGLMSPYANVNLRCSTNRKTVTETDATKQKQIIATEMANCWEQFGEGKLKLFALESGTYCVVCSRLEFKEHPKLDHFTEYLFETQIPGKQKTYYQYLFTTEGTAPIANAYRNSKFADQDTLDTSVPMAVMFVARKNIDSWYDYAASAAGAGLGVVGTAIAMTGIGAPIGVPVLIAGAALAGTTTHYMAGPYLTGQEFAAATVIWPYDDIAALKCNRLEGSAGQLGFT